MTTVFIISAPSGSGKSTLVNEVRRIIPGLEFSVSYTTRPPRGSEQHGREYFFVSRAEFLDMLRRSEFLEHAEVFGDYYGTSRRFLREAEQRGSDLVLDIDVQGAKQMRQQLPGAVSVFILPPDRKTLEWRLRNRGLNDEGTIKKRLAAAKQEIENYEAYAYILINDVLEQSVDKLKAIMLTERDKHSGQAPADAALAAIAEKCSLNEVRERVKPILDSFRDVGPENLP
jgi:guanylate kinase